MIHIHSWKQELAQAEAYWRKDNWPEDKAIFHSGPLQRCSCGQCRIITKFGPVEVYP